MLCFSLCCDNIFLYKSLGTCSTLSTHITAEIGGLLGGKKSKRTVFICHCVQINLTLSNSAFEKLENLRGRS